MANIAKVLFATIDTPIGKVEVWSDDREQVAAAVKAGDKIRSIDYLYFPSLTIPAKGKKPASFATMTLAEYKEHEDSLSDPRMPASVYLSKKAPLLNAACMSDDTQIRDTFAIVLTMVKEYEATKPSGASPVRNVKEYMTAKLADLYLIAAGITGVIPEELELEAIFAAARAQALDKAQKLGMDSNNQYRLKAEKKAKDAVTPEEDGE